MKPAPPWIFLLIAAAVPAVFAQAQPDHPSQSEIMSVARLFRADLDQHGIAGVAAAIGRCYLDASAAPSTDAVTSAIRRCMLWDISAMQLDKIMRQLFTGQGQDPGPPPPFLTGKAYNARLNTYGVIAFGPDLPGFDQYFGDAPTQVIGELQKLGS